MSFEIINLSAYTAPRAEEVGRKGYVEYGLDNSKDKSYKNDYFQFLIDLSVNSTTNGAIINAISRMIYGKGIAATDANRKPDEWARFVSILSAGDLRKVCNDYKRLGMACFNITKSRGEITKISHFPMQTLRAEIANDDGEIEAWYYHPKWSEKKNNEDPERIPAFGFGSNSGNEVYVICPYVSGFHYYAPPDYSGALPYAVLEDEISDYLVNDVKNHFSGTTVINFNNDQIPDEEKRHEIALDVKNKLTGSTADKVVVAFNANSENVTTVEKIPLDDAPNHYQYLSTEAFNKLIAGHRVTSPMLLGIRDGSNGLGNNAEEIETATRLMSNLTIRPFQLEIIEALDEILASEGMAFNLYFKTIEPLEFIGTSNMDSETQEEETGVDLSEQSDPLQDFIDSGEEPGEDWELVDEREVDYDMEEHLDAEIDKLNEPKVGLFRQFINLVSTGTARPNRESEQDVEKDGYLYKVRYKYDGSISSNTRPFCARMMAAGKIYRKEDIIRMENRSVNPGWGAGGADTYSIWLYKGGGNCHHKWLRQTFKIRGERGSILGPKSEQISTGQARREGVNPVNEREVSMKPKDMPNQGFLNPR